MNNETQPASVVLTTTVGVCLSLERHKELLEAEAAWEEVRALLVKMGTYEADEAGEPTPKRMAADVAIIGWSGEFWYSTALAAEAPR